MYWRFCGAVFLPIGIALAGCAGPNPDSAGPTVAGAAARPKSYVELKYGSTVRQMLDFSCGAAALATLTTHYWGTPLSEGEVLTILLAPYSDEEKKKKKESGFSFADLKAAAHYFGFEAEGAKIDPAELSRLAGPVIVHLDKGTFQHFSVLRRAGNGTYYLSDPVTGAIAMQDREFEKQYTGFALAVWRPGSRLPGSTPLTKVRDGTDVSLSVGRMVNESARVFTPSF